MNHSPAPLTLHSGMYHLEYQLHGRTIHDGMALEVLSGGNWVWGLYSWVYESQHAPKLLFRAGRERRQRSLEIRAGTPCRVPLEPRLYA